MSQAMPSDELFDNGWISVIFSVPLWLVTIFSLLLAYYMHCTWHYGIFKKLGINGPKPIPVFGTSLSMMKVGFANHDMEMRKYGNVVGTFQGRTPVMIIYDVEILKQILIKDFSSFTNRIVPPAVQYPLGKMMHFTKDDEWKHIRSVVSPTFSSGKLRKMNGQIRQCADTLLVNMTEHAKKGETFDFAQLCKAFTMDVIASTAFGIKIDSHNNPNNQFVQMGKKAFSFKLHSLAMVIFLFFPFLLPPLGKLGYTFFPKDVTLFFVNVINSAMGGRKLDTDEKSIDFLQLMINAHNNDDEDEESKKSAGDYKTEAATSDSKPWTGLTREEILGQGLLFFLAGFETTANTLSLLGYSLATHPECQEKLIQEIDTVMKDHKVVDYDVVKKMVYLDMCINETLRLYPPGIRTDRVAGRDVTINGVRIPKDMHIIVPVTVLQKDPEAWPNPEEFNPERFTAEEKEARHPMYFMPFGSGPRNCVGMRLALTELRISVATILQKMKFVASAETEIPLQLDKIAMRGANGIKLKLEMRQAN